ncbi:hypothetical protein CSA08_02190 [Candidatus Gracilibacteria bacterium]|nr:MAG: hypothetical protein CSA08_02190 [Candidatus Gracilibacteria bacterium]
MERNIQKNKTKVGIDCDNADGVLYNLFSFHSGARKILEKIIGIHYNGNFSIKNKFYAEDMLKNILLNEEKKRTFFDMLKKVSGEIEGGDVILEAMKQYEEEHSNKIFSKIVEDTREKIMRQIETKIEEKSETKLKDFNKIFGGIKGIELKQETVISGELLTEIAKSLNYHSLILFYKKIKELKITKSDKELLELYLNHDIKYGYLKFSKEDFEDYPLEEYIDNEINPILSKAINEGWIE